MEVSDDLRQRFEVARQNSLTTALKIELPDQIKIAKAGLEALIKRAETALANGNMTEFVDAAETKKLALKEISKLEALGLEIKAALREIERG